jgi:hypothetical protein
MFIPYSLLFLIAGIFFLVLSMFVLGTYIANKNDDLPKIVMIASFVIALVFFGMAMGANFMVSHFEGLSAMTLVLAPDGSLQTPEDAGNYDTN